MQEMQQPQDKPYEIVRRSRGEIRASAGRICAVPEVDFNALSRAASCAETRSISELRGLAGNRDRGERQINQLSDSSLLWESSAQSPDAADLCERCEMIREWKARTRALKRLRDDIKSSERLLKRMKRRFNRKGRKLQALKSELHSLKLRCRGKRKIEDDSE